MRRETKLFKALSDPNRIRIIKMLQERELCVCEIADILDLAYSTVSKHLAVLRDTEMILDRKAGKWVNYRLNPDAGDEQVRELLALVQQWLNDDATVCADRAAVRSVDRDIICNITPKKENT